MSYNLHITHKAHWADEKSDKKISLDEFLKYVKSRSDLKIEHEDLDKKCVEVAYYVEGSKYDPHFLIQYRDGDITSLSRYTDRLGFLLLLDFANKFSASIQGDEGELYTEKDQASFPTYEEMEKRSEEMRQKAFKRNIEEIDKQIDRLRRHIILSAIVLVGLVFLPSNLRRLGALKTKKAALLKDYNSSDN